MQIFATEAVANAAEWDGDLPKAILLTDTISRLVELLKNDDAQVGLPPVNMSVRPQHRCARLWGFRLEYASGR